MELTLEPGPQAPVNDAGRRVGDAAVNGSADVDGVCAGGACAAARCKGAGCVGGVCLGGVAVGDMTVEQLRSSLGVLGRRDSASAALKARLLAALGKLSNAVDAQQVAVNELGASRREAKREVETASQLEQLPDTSEALGSGEIPVGHAHLIARASGEGPIDEAELVDAAGKQTLDQFAKTVRRHQQAQSADDGQALLDRQRQRRTARIFQTPDTDMFVLTAQFDPITGARIATALTAKESELWHNEDPKARRTPPQRMADALAELICESGSGKQGTDLLVIADLDVVKGQLDNPRLVNGNPVPITEVRDLALDANILPAIFDAKTQDMWLGRSRRIASDAQRMALMARDQHCIGCEANPLWCRVHHIVWWSKGGPTDLDNLVLVCDRCHHKIHDHGWQVQQDRATRKYCLKPPAEPD